MATLISVQRSLLDSLMGPNRNGTVGKRMHFSDPEVCRPYLMGLCPCDLLQSTKSDLGICLKVHADNLKREYEQANKEKDLGYEHDLYLVIEPAVRDCDRKIERARARLQIHHETNDSQPKEETEEVKQLSLQISELQSKAEALGNEGKVDESLKMMEEAEALGAKRDTLTLIHNHAPPAGVAQSNQHKLHICDVCSASLSIFDSQERLQDHFRGRQHTGYKSMREKLEELRAKGIDGRRVAPTRPRSASRKRSASPRPREERDRYRERDQYHESRGGRFDRSSDRRDYDRRGGDRRENHRNRGFDDRNRGFDDRNRGFDDRNRGFDDRNRGFDDRNRGFDDRNRYRR